MIRSKSYIQGGSLRILITTRNDSQRNHRETTTIEADAEILRGGGVMVGLMVQEDQAVKEAEIVAEEMGVVQAVVVGIMEEARKTPVVERFSNNRRQWK
jgi:hypothetical protein